MSAKPRIAIIMDENTSVDGTRYEMTKNYFIGIQRAGGLPFGIPYFAEMVDSVVANSMDSSASADASSFRMNGMFPVTDRCIRPRSGSRSSGRS